MRFLDALRVVGVQAGEDDNRDHRNGGPECALTDEDVDRERPVGRCHVPVRHGKGVAAVGTFDFLQAKGALLFPPAPPPEIALTVEAMGARYQALLPADYSDFLGMADGALWAGVVLHGCRPQECMTGMELDSLEEINDGLARLNARRIVVIGMLDDELIVFDGDSRLYAVVDRIDFSPFFSHPTLRGLVEEIDHILC